MHDKNEFTILRTKQATMFVCDIHSKCLERRLEKLFPPFFPIFIIFHYSLGTLIHNKYFNKTDDCVQMYEEEKKKCMTSIQRTHSQTRYETS